ncbi:MAG TPA: ABC transporter permease, partial [Gemmatimonadales bacterium]|nr:ABC transporter permease [Gemmatimonadales bacterium]
GSSRAEAERLAHAHFGAVAGTKDDARDARGIALLDNFARDLRFAARSLRSRKAFSLGVILTLALGIGVNATMFGILDRLLWRAPATLRDPATVHRIYRYSTDNGEIRIDRNFSFPTYLDLSRGSRSLKEVVPFQTRDLAVGEGDDAMEVRVTVAGAGYFDLFAAVPVQGRFYTRAEDTPPAGAPVAVLGYEFWQTRFGGQGVIGQTLRVDRILCTIIGIAPRGFVGMSDQGVPAVYLPITTYAHALRGTRYPGNYNWSWLELVARRDPAVSREAAETELTAGFIRSWRSAEAFDAGWGNAEAQRLRGELGPIQIGRGPDAGPETKVAAWIGGVALIVLLIACANVANLLLSRAVSRRAELGMRAALGASRLRILSQVLTESLLLAGLGGVAGLALAQWGAGGLRAWFLPADLDVGVLTDGRTLLFTLAATVAAAALIGLVPAIHAGRQGAAGSLRIDGRQRGYERSRLRTALLVLQPALSVILLVGAVLFVRSLRHVRDFRLGYDVEPVVLAAASLRGTQLGPAGQRELNERMLAAAQTIPGVQWATLAASIPFWSNEGRGLYVTGVDSVNKLGRFILQAGTPDYFRTMGTRVLRGRPFDGTDRAGGPRVAVVSEGMARAVWPDREAIGQCFRIGSDTMPCTTVIGVAEDMRVRSLTDPREFTYYLPAAQYEGPLDPVVLARVGGRARDYL